MQWFRWHHGSCEDAKFRVTARNAGVTVRDVLALWAALLEAASKANNRGTISNDAMAFVETILDFEPAEADRIVMAMEEANLVETTEFAIKIINWERRQFKTDASDPTNAERQKRWRKQKRDSNTQCNWSRNGTVTATENREQRTESDPPLPPKGGIDRLNGHSKGIEVATALLTSNAYDAAREAAPGWDVYHLESRWREHYGGTSVNAPDKAFVGFCRKFTKGKSPS